MNKKIKFVLIIFIIIVVMLLGIIFFRYNILKDILTRYNKSISDINYYYSYENEDYTNSVWRKGDLILQESYLKSDNSKVITWRDRTTNEGYKLFDIICFDFIMITKLKLPEKIYPETAGAKGYDNFGFNAKSQTIKIVVFCGISLLLAFVLTVITRR